MQGNAMNTRLVVFPLLAGKTDDPAPVVESKCNINAKCTSVTIPIAVT